jgi:hypothetical protein
MTLSSRHDHQEYKNLVGGNDIEKRAVHVQLGVVVNEDNRCRRGLTDDARCREAA